MAAEPGSVSIREASNGRLELHGSLSFTSVPPLWADFAGHLAKREQLEIDLAGVERSDSAGLAFLVECLRSAHKAGKNILFFNIPAQMLAIARASSLDQVLPLQRD